MTHITLISRLFIGKKMIGSGILKHTVFDVLNLFISYYLGKGRLAQPIAQPIGSAEVLMCPKNISINISRFTLFNSDILPYTFVNFSLEY